MANRSSVDSDAERKAGTGWSGTSTESPVPTPDPSVSAAFAAVPATIEHRSPYMSTCPFLRSVGDAGRTGLPIEEPDLANRCGAFGEAKAQSSRQQELVCLTRSHADCPRFLRGALLLREAAEGLRARTLTRATLASLVLLALSAGASLAFVVARGGLAMPIPSVGPQGAAAATAMPSRPRPTVAPGTIHTPAPAARVAAPPTRPPAPSPSPAPRASPEPSPSATPAPTPSPEPTARPPARATPAPAPTSKRYASLDRCPDRPRCWIYTVRTGNNLYSIGRYYGHSLETIYAWNPWTRTTPLREGHNLRMPPPTR